MDAHDCKEGGGVVLRIHPPPSRARQISKTQVAEEPPLPLRYLPRGWGPTEAPSALLQAPRRRHGSELHPRAAAAQRSARTQQTRCYRVPIRARRGVGRPPARKALASRQGAPGALAAQPAWFVSIMSAIEAACRWPSPRGPAAARRAARLARQQ